jgi:hypothetical protein
MLNDVIKCYTLIFCSYILFTIDDITSCMYCGIHVGAPSLSLKPGVIGVVEMRGKTVGFDYCHYSCLFNLCVELLLASSCSTFVDGFHVYCKNDTTVKQMLSPAKLTYIGLLENRQKLLNFRRLEASDVSYLNLRWLAVGRWN